ncbi:MAG: AsmA-like C-terminal domain-containing protein [Sedimentisphaerales bacterium]|nr:AsmA-like C-terminal domain-containing protein [Sedimentisphaerales bacterium]
MAQSKTHKSKFVNTIRWLVSLLILAVLLWFLYIYAVRALCHIALGQIAELTNTKISVDSVDFHTDGSVYIENLVIRPRKSQNDFAAILEADKVHARFSPGSILLLRPRLQVIDINDFVFNAQYDLDTGRSNLSELEIKPPEHSFSKMPGIHLNRGRLLYSKISQGRQEVSASMPVHANFGPDEESQQGYVFDITTATMASGFGQSRLTGKWKRGLVTFTGGISSMDVPELEMAWIIDVLAAQLKYDPNDNFSLELRIKDLQSKRSESLSKLATAGPPFLEKSDIFTALQLFFDRYQPKGNINVDIDVTGNLNRLNESTLTGRVDCKNVAFVFSDFKYAIENLTGQIDFTREGVTFSDLAGRHGDVNLIFDGWYRAFGPDRSYEVGITGDRLPLDSDLYDALNEKQRDFWDLFSPVGYISVDLKLSRSSGMDRRVSLETGLDGVDAVYRNFPYPLKNLSGKMLFDRDGIKFSDVISQEDERKIILNGRIKTAGSNMLSYDILVDVGHIPLDSVLEDVLPENQKRFYQKYNPSGFADGWIKVLAQDGQPVDFIANLSFSEASLNLDKLAADVTDISARAVFTPDSIDVKEFAGMYGESPVRMMGHFQPVRDMQVLYVMALSLEQIQFNEDLLGLLPESLKKVVSELKPAGNVDIVAELNKLNVIESPEYRVTVHCLDNSINLPDFPNPLRNITGGLVIDSDGVEFDDVLLSICDIDPAAEIIAAVNLDGEMYLDDGVLSGASLRFTADDISFDERLKQIIPHAGDLCDKLLPVGSFALDFNDVRIRFGENGQKFVDFAGEIILDDCGLNVSGADIELDLKLKTQGMYQTEGGLCRCRASIDGGRIRIQEKTLTDMEANIFYDPNQRKWFTEKFISDCYGGKTTGKFELVLSDDACMEHVLQIAFDNVDLKQYLADANLACAGDNNYSSGKMSGSLSINTRVTGESSRIGSLRLTIKDMQVGKLSPIGKLLQVLNLTEPKDYAFDRMFVDSYIKDNRLFVEKLDLSGKGIAFYGSGWMDLVNRNINLALTARGRRLATDDPSILQSLTEGLGQAVVRIDITGNFDNPVVTTKTLPVLEETLQILGTRSKASD